MKTRPLLLALSLVANIALAFAITRHSPDWVSFLPWRRGTSSAETRTSASAAAAAQAKPEKFDAKLWGTLSGGDLAAVAARLKADGFPISVQRAILGALVAEKFADRHRALAQRINALPWWANWFSGGLPGDVVAERQKLQRDEREAVDALVGSDSGSSGYARAQQTQKYGQLSDAKFTELDRINNDYAELIREVRNASQGILLPEDREKILYLENEKRADITKLLTPDELLEYDLRSSPSANWLRNQLVAFNPTEDGKRSTWTW